LLIGIGADPVCGVVAHGSHIGGKCTVGAQAGGQFVGFALCQHVLDPLFGHTGGLHA